MKKYDIIIIGSGPGGYTASIRAAQLGMKVCIIEKEKLGGTCLNWGCVPTKSLIKSIKILENIKNSSEYGIDVKKVNINFKKIINRSRKIVEEISKGAECILKKNKIDIVYDTGVLKSNKTIELKKKKCIYSAKNIIIATGSRNKDTSNIKIDGKKVIGYKEIVLLKKIPKSMTIIGSGSIGIEFSYFYNSIGTKITIIEPGENILPKQDKDVSSYIEKHLKEKNIEIYKKSKIIRIEKKKECEIIIKNEEKYEKIKSEIIFLAISKKSNIENIGIENIGIKVKNDKIITNEFYETNIKGIYAIGDIINTPSLAHVASAEGIICVEKISGINVEKIDYDNIPSCIYYNPEISSIGKTEKELKKKKYKTGKFYFRNSENSIISGEKEGFIKIIFDIKSNEIIGAHMIGNNVIEIISEITIAKKVKLTIDDIIKIIHPHPTISESITEVSKIINKKK